MVVRTLYVCTGGATIYIGAEGQYPSHLAKVGAKRGQKIWSFKQSKKCKFMPKMHQNTFGGQALPGPTCNVQHPQDCTVLC